MKRLSFFLFLLLFVLNCTLAQSSNTNNQEEEDLPNSKAASEKLYNERIKKERLFGVYIPKDEQEAIEQLNAKIDNASKAKFKNLSEYDAVHKLYFSFGRWIIQNWGLTLGSRYSHYIKTTYNASYPEDIATLTILAYHRTLNHKPLDLKKEGKSMVEKRKKERDERLLKNGKVLLEQTIKK